MAPDALEERHQNPERGAETVLGELLFVGGGAGSAGGVTVWATSQTSSDRASAGITVYSRENSIFHSS